MVNVVLLIGANKLIRKSKMKLNLNKKKLKTLSKASVRIPSDATKQVAGGWVSRDVWCSYQNCTTRLC